MDSGLAKLNDILFILKEKHKNMENLMVFTREMEKVVAANDLESLGAVLSMRQESMDKIDALNADVAKTLAGIGEPYNDKVKKILKSREGPIQFDNPLEKHIFDTNRMTLSLLKKIIALDGEINNRIKGDAKVFADKTV